MDYIRYVSESEWRSRQDDEEFTMGKRLWVERNKDGSWDAFSEDGAHIKFGKGRGQFTPGDLMKIALAGCAALSSQFAVEHTLGEGKGAKIVVDGTYDATTTLISVSTSRWSSTLPTRPERRGYREIQGTCHPSY
mgnify:CR=1 FL=1